MLALQTENGLSTVTQAEKLHMSSYMYSETLV